MEELIFGGAIQRRVFCVTSLGGLYLEGLIHGGAYFRNFTVSSEHSGVGGKIRRTEHSVTYHSVKSGTVCLLIILVNRF